jgi:hypothetical protein
MNMHPEGIHQEVLGPHRKKKRELRSGECAGQETEASCPQAIERAG